MILMTWFPAFGHFVFLGLWVAYLVNFWVGRSGCRWVGSALVWGEGYEDKPQRAAGTMISIYDPRRPTGAGLSQPARQTAFSGGQGPLAGGRQGCTNYER